MKKYFRLGLKEIWNNKKFALFFIFNLALGLSGFVTLDAFKNGLEKTLLERSKAILGADIGIGARRAITAEERALTERVLNGYKDKTETFETYSMLSLNGNSRLVEIKAVQANYPFYGDIELQKSGVVGRGAGVRLQNEPTIWSYPELLLQLSVKVGDTIQIGSQKFQLADEVMRDASGVGGGFSFAPPIYVGFEQFKKTGLVRVGSTGYFSILYELGPRQDPEALAKELNVALKDPALRVFTFRDASEQVGKMLSMLTDYLGLAAVGRLGIFRCRSRR